MQCTHNRCKYDLCASGGVWWDLGSVSSSFSGCCLFSVCSWPYFHVILMDIHSFQRFPPQSPSRPLVKETCPSNMQFKQTVCWQCYNHLSVFFSSINMWKPRVAVNLFDLWPLLCVSQTTNNCSCDGGIPVGSHPQAPVQTDWAMSAQRQQWVSKKKWLL